MASHPVLESASRVARVMPVMLRTGMAHMLQYRGEIALWALWGVVFPAVSMAMWSAAGAGRPLAGYERVDIAAYFLMTMIVGHVTAAWDVFEMGWQVQSGNLSAKLLRPMLPIWEGIADNIAYKVVTCVLLVPTWIVFAVYTGARFQASAATMAAGLAALLLAAFVAYIWGYVLATLAFFITRLEGVAELFFGLSLFLGGRFAAIDWLPGPLQALTWAFPFRWCVAFPCEALIGRLDLGDIARGCAWQLGWLAAGLATFRWLWPRGVRRYAAVGA